MNPRTPRSVAVGPGTVLCDRFLVEQMIGRGGTAVVFRARDMTSSRGSEPNLQIAIKTPRPELADRPRAVARLRHEFENASRLAHPNIVRVLEFHDDPSHCFIAMELVEGRLLSSLIRDWTMLAPPLTQKILRDCAQALAHAHRHGVVHGDFKPGNVFVTADEEIKVVDFGASALTLAPDESRIAAGTPAYASPEVLSGVAPDPRDDVFSFACVAYELLTGQHPFERKSSLHARSEGVVPQRAWSLGTKQWLGLLSALSWERTQRPADIETLMAALTAESPAASAAAPIHASPAMPTELRAELMPRPSSWGFFVFLACAIAIVVVAFQRPRQVVPAPKPAAMTSAVPHGMPMQATTPAPAQRNAEGGVPESASQPAAAPAASPAVAKAAAAAPGNAKVSSPAAAAAGAPARAPASSRSSTSSVAPAKSAPAKATPASTRPAGAVSLLSFESRSIVTAESSVAAVFVIKRSPPLTGRVRVQWVAESGTAQAGVDFANARGTVEFADGQTQRAIYVPLRNDLQKEGDEKFTVRLLSPQGAKLGPISRAEATIIDDD